eukprot:IDg13314t1
MLRNVDAPEKGTGLQDSSGQFVTLRPNEEEFERQTVGLKMSHAAAQRKAAQASFSPSDPSLADPGAPTPLQNGADGIAAEPLPMVGKEAHVQNGSVLQPVRMNPPNGDALKDLPPTAAGTVGDGENKRGLNQSDMASKQTGESHRARGRQFRNAGNGRHNHGANLNSNRANHMRPHQHPGGGGLPAFSHPGAFPPGMM